MRWTGNPEFLELRFARKDIFVRSTFRDSKASRLSIADDFGELVVED